MTEAGAARRQRRVARRAGLWAAVLVAVPYAVTLPPGMSGFGDVPKFQYTPVVLGTPHQPGYPVFTMLSALWVRVVPVGSAAFRVNLLTALLAIAAVALLAYVLVDIGMSVAPAVGSAVAIGLGEAYWIIAVEAEVYSLQVLLTLVVVHALLRWWRHGHRSALWPAIAAIAVGVGNHPTTALLLIAWVVAMRWGPHEVPWRWLVPRLGTGLLAGLATYLYLWWRTVAAPEWSETAVTGVADLVDALLGTQYRTGGVSLVPIPAGQMTVLVLGAVVLGVGMLVIGLVYLGRVDPAAQPLKLFGVVFVGLHVPLVVIWRIFDIAEMVVAAIVVLGLLGAAGLRLAPGIIRGVAITGSVVLLLVANAPARWQARPAVDEEFRVLTAGIGDRPVAAGYTAMQRARYQAVVTADGEPSPPDDWHVGGGAHPGYVAAQACALGLRGPIVVVVANPDPTPPEHAHLEERNAAGSRWAIDLEDGLTC